MSYPEQKVLDEYRKRLQKCKEEIKKAEEYFGGLAKKEEDITKRTTLVLLSQYAIFMRDLYSQIETWSIAQTALKSQIELLRDIVVQLPDIKNSPEIMNEIQKLFKEYNKSV